MAFHRICLTFSGAPSCSIESGLATSLTELSKSSGKQLAWRSIVALNATPSTRAVLKEYALKSVFWRSENRRCFFQERNLQTLTILQKACWNLSLKSFKDRTRVPRSRFPESSGGSQSECCNDNLGEKFQLLGLLLNHPKYRRLSPVTSEAFGLLGMSG